MRLVTTGLTGGARSVAGKTGAARGDKQSMITDQFRPRPSPAPCRSSGPPLDVAQWRWCRLREAGFPAALARSLAGKHIDLHALLELGDAGCPPALAARILSPLDDVDAAVHVDEPRAS